MRYQKLGNTDIDVSVIALGTWGLGGGSVWTDRDSTVEDTRNLLDGSLLATIVFQLQFYHVDVA